MSVPFSFDVGSFLGKPKRKQLVAPPYMEQDSRRDSLMEGYEAPNPPSHHPAYQGSSRDTAMLTPETKATT